MKPLDRGSVLEVWNLLILTELIPGPNQLLITWEQKVHFVWYSEQHNLLIQLFFKLCFFCFLEKKNFCPNTKIHFSCVISTIFWQKNERVCYFFRPKKLRVFYLDKEKNCIFILANFLQNLMMTEILLFSLFTLLLFSFFIASIYS